MSSADARVSRLLRRTLPEFYVATWAFGSLGVLGGVPALRDTFGEEYAQILGFAIASASLVSLVGIAWPARLWRLEFYAVSLLSGLVLLYAAAVLFAGVTSNDVGRTAVAAAIYAISTLPRWRVTDIARERQVHGWR
ncbi:MULTISPECIES: hypothetical protein [unclassified Frigoribacterium]|uniref:hypothetical protein n=1 Tax=unclassified Frigoribacterium TaxID=2627005 RepID=UPI001AE989C9|nr:hypothetical protein [Frigoribacterium sp. PvP121]MBP1241754.1 hypothetical protein [Frigoribacterium sp. PvP121]